MPALSGMRIVVTRAVHQAEELACPLRDLGADVILLPLIEIAPPSDPEPLRRAASRADEYDWIIFTSANAVAAFAAELPRPPASCKARVATVGPATRRAAEERGFRISLMPPSYIAEVLAEVLRLEKLNGRRILIPSAAVTRDVVAAELAKCGAEVELVEAYRNVLPPEALQRAREIFQEPYPDWVVFASPSAVNHLVDLVGVDPLQRAKIASIGPITSEAICKCGLAVTVEASAHTSDGLVEAIAQHSSAPSSTRVGYSGEGVC